MADSQQFSSSATTTTTTGGGGTTLPAAIIHRLPNFSLSFFPWIKQVVNPIDHSDPSYPIHAPSARALIVIGPSPLKSEHLDKYPALECVVGTSAGVDHIDLAECRRRNIRVTSAGDAFSEDVADYAVALLIDVLRRVSAADRYVRAGLWAVEGEYPLGSKLRGKRVGILGLGSIGSMVAKRLEPFGCTIAYTSRTPKPHVPFPFHSTAVDLAAHSDALIVCCSLTGKTHKIVNDDVLRALGPGGVVVNVGRGALVDEAALVRSLARGRLGGAGLDVFEDEPKVPKELFAMDNVVLSPHKAVLTPESFAALREVITGNLRAFFSDKPLVSELNLDD